MTIISSRTATTSHARFRYREGAHGEHCIDSGTFEWTRNATVGRAASDDDAIRIVAQLNSLTVVHSDLIETPEELSEARRVENLRLRAAIAELHRVWFAGADLNKDAISQACLKLFSAAAGR